MKNKITGLILLLFVFIVPLFTVHARTCEYGIPSPPIYYNGTWSATPANPFVFTTSASSCLARNISVYFNDGSYIFGSAFDLEGMLMEYDYNGNPHDPVKLYRAHNQPGTGLVWSTNVEVLDNGNLDSAGDRTCELFMKFRVNPSLAQNNVEYFDADMFRYTICVD